MTDDEAPHSIQFVIRHSSFARTHHSTPDMTLPGQPGGKHDTKSVTVVATVGFVVSTVRRQQSVVFVVNPRSTPHHTVAVSKSPQVFAPLPYIPTQIMEAEAICRKAAHRCRERKVVAIALQFLMHLRLLSAVITRAVWRWPF